jgi:TPR repeat protein
LSELLKGHLRIQAVVFHCFKGRWNKTMPVSFDPMLEVSSGDFMRFLSQFTILLLLLAVLVPLAYGGNVEDGLVAAESGDFKTAHSLWLAESEKGNPAAQGYLGILYLKGQGVAKDEQLALKWLRSAADGGDATAQTNLGALYIQGQSVEVDYDKAVHWFRLAGNQGDPNAQSYLGVMYARGQGVQQSDAQAAKWFHMAARRGDAKAQLSLGVMYDVGRGVAQNPVVACAWYSLALENGEATAQRALETTKKKMTEVEIEISEQIAEQLRMDIGR